MRRFVIIAICALVVAAGAYNVYGERESVQAQAAALCGARCALRGYEMNAVGRDYLFQRQGARVTVHCRRGFYLVGAWECAERGP